MNRRDSYNKAFLGFLLISLLVHLMALYLFKGQSLFPDTAEPERVYVEVREPQAPRKRELDVPPPPEPEERQTPAKRLGPADQVAPKEVAPRGDAPEDRSPPPTPRQPVKPKPKPVKPKPEPKKQPPERTVDQQGERPASVEKTPETAEKAPVAPRPDIEKLTRLTPDTVARLKSEQWRRKYRSEVEEGDAVWLDMEEDLLFSFFNRLRDNIYLVWQYPAEARQRRIEGTCLVEMVINRDGSVRSVKVLESSGSEILDQEAVEAVRKGAPYGKLPRVYEKDSIRVLANFQYTISRKIIY
ncbi:MAG: energy transducer TonB [Desulfuromonadales bacterium]|nr:energy transducer TonB [Desulfuromonadales bacterium]NIR33738.1 energy transducer TonB [Desulfuromonadales bacterium]NIS43734.1 energy transducer TonB [Desulfuromonadales bacterium]